MRYTIFSFFFFSLEIISNVHASLHIFEEQNGNPKRRNKEKKTPPCEETC